MARPSIKLSNSFFKDFFRFKCGLRGLGRSSQQPISSNKQGINCHIEHTLLFFFYFCVIKFFYCTVIFKRSHFHHGHRVTVLQHTGFSH